MDRAFAVAGSVGVAPHEILLSLGWVDEGLYVGDLAQALGIMRLPEAAASAHDRLIGFGAALVERDGGALLVVDAVRRSPADVAHLIDQSGWPADRTALATASEFDGLAAAVMGAVWMDEAVNGLRNRAPGLSALGGAAPWQIVGFAALLAVGFAALLVAPDLTLGLLSATVTLAFLSVAVMRVLALRHGLAEPAEAPRDGRIADRDLPIYTLLVPLFREAEIVRELVGRLAALDYPACKLDILIILEAGDDETRRAVSALSLPASMRLVIVPPGGPQTKPKALNFALHLARGEYVVVYDAEDFPERDQLRRAIAAFRRGGPKLACLQACLNIYNPRASWLTRQFTLEYSGQFDATLPTLVRLGLPVPLGGTSNHFPMAVLRGLGGWDPYNVTEDADLGLRIARAGLEVRMLPSTTWEEAPETFGPWLRQRTRWLKGWFTTWIVHMRRPGALLRELGLRQFLGWQAFMAGIALSVLVHGVFSLVTLYELAFGALRPGPSAPIQTALAWLAIGTMATGIAASMTLGAVAARRRGRGYLARSLLLTPVYWIAISLAAYRALWQLLRAPHHWEKTPHGIARQQEMPPPDAPAVAGRRTRWSS